MNIKLIKTEKEYQAALLRLEKIFDAKLGSKEGRELEILAHLIEKYENEDHQDSSHGITVYIKPN